MRKIQIIGMSYFPSTKQTHFATHQNGNECVQMFFLSQKIKSKAELVKIMTEEHLWDEVEIAKTVIEEIEALNEKPKTQPPTTQTN